jgi:hypothetical protein
MMSEERKPGALGSNDGLGAGAEARCTCKDRALSACPGEWEPGCDLGNNPAHVRLYRKPISFWAGFVDGLGLGALWRWLARL